MLQVPLEPQSAVIAGPFLVKCKHTDGSSSKPFLRVFQRKPKGNPFFFGGGLELYVLGVSAEAFALGREVRADETSHYRRRSAHAPRIRRLKAIEHSPGRAGVGGGKSNP